MRLSEQYVRACFPVRRRILGRKMQDFTAAHAELLDVIGYDASSVGTADLLAAVRICSLPRRKAARYVRRGGRFAIDVFWLIVFRLQPEIFRAAVADFQAYLDAANETPDFWADEKETRTSTCPSLLMLTRDLANYWHHTEEQILDMPLAQAEWKRLAILEAAGVLDFKTDEDNETLEQARQMAREYAERGGSWE